MQVKQFKTAKFSALQELAVIIQSGTQSDILQAVESLQHSGTFTGKAWIQGFAKLHEAIRTGLPGFSVLSLGGNSKLPFVAFSSLPGVTCPGAGECLEFCYSFRAWRYPAAFFRMAQNAYLMRFYPDVIKSELEKIYAKNPSFDFRLYVDGDFATASDVKFWFELLAGFPGIRAYGYSKSFAAILQHVNTGGTIPGNYMLNISSGHNSNSAIVDKIKALHITRGEFIAVSIGRKVNSSMHGTPENNKLIRQVMGDTKVFPCPGKCGECTGAGHACGLPAMKGRVIAIAVH